MIHWSHWQCVGLAAAGLVVAGISWGNPAMAAGIEMAEYTVPSDPGVQLYVREKHPAGV